MQSTETGDEATRPDKARPEFAALATRAASLAPERFYSPSAVLIRDLLAALAAERDRADWAEAGLAEAWDAGRKVSNNSGTWIENEQRGTRTFVPTPNPYRSEAAV